MLDSSRLAVSNLALWSIVIEPKCFAYKHATTSDMQILVAIGAASKDQRPPSSSKDQRPPSLPQRIQSLFHKMGQESADIHTLYSNFGDEETVL